MSSVAQPRISFPSNVMLPSVRTMPHSARSVVVLPAPLAPSRVTMLPCCTLSETPRMAFTGP